MFSSRPYKEAQKRKKEWIELKKANDLLSRVDNFERRLISLEDEIDQMLDDIDEISRIKSNRLQDTKGHSPSSPEKRKT